MTTSGWADDNTTGFLRAQLGVSSLRFAVRVNLSADYTRSRAAPSPMIATALGSFTRAPCPTRFYADAMWANVSGMGMFMRRNHGHAILRNCASVRPEQGRATNPGLLRERSTYRGKECVRDHGGFLRHPTAISIPIPTNEGRRARRGACHDRGRYRHRHLQVNHGLSRVPSPISVTTTTTREVAICSRISTTISTRTGKSQEFQLVGNALDGRLDFTTAGLYAFAETGTEVVSLIGTSTGLTVNAAGRPERKARSFPENRPGYRQQLQTPCTARSPTTSTQPFHLTVGLRVPHEDDKGVRRDGSSRFHVPTTPTG